MATSIPFTFATPVTSYQQGMQAGDQLQQNALALAQQRQDVSDNNALRTALSAGIGASPDAQQNALAGLAQAAPNKVTDFNQVIGGMNAQQQAAAQAKAQSVVQDLGSLVAIPDGPAREAAYQQTLDREQAQGADVSHLRGLPANQGIRMAFLKAQSIQDAIKNLQPQTVKLGANEQQITTDPVTGVRTVLQGQGEEKYVNDYNTGRRDPSTGQPILAQGFVGPNGFRPIGLAGSPSSGASGAGGFANPGGLMGAVQTVESGNNPNAVSPAGAQGLMQLLPSTAANPGFGITPAKDNSPAENQRVGQQYLSALLDKYNGNVPLALAAYNAGPGAVDNAVSKSNGNINAAISLLPAETQAYVPKVLQTLQQAQGGAQAVPVNVSDSVPTTATVAPDGTMTAVAQPNAGTTVAAQTGALPGGFYTKAAEQKNAPSGYRFKTDGSLEVIPGGPADKGLAGQSIGDASKTGDDYLASIPDPGLRHLVQAIADGREEVPKIYRPSKGGEIGATDIAEAVNTYDPSFEAGNAGARANALKNFTSASSPNAPANQIRSIQTIAAHLSTLVNNLPRLDLGSTSTGNAVQNWVNSEQGYTNPDRTRALGAYDQDVKSIADETAKLFAGTGSALSDREHVAAMLGRNQPVEKLQGSLGELGTLVGGRLEALDNQANTGLGPRLAAKLNILPPQMRAVLAGVQDMASTGKYTGPTVNTSLAAPQNGPAQATPTQRIVPPPVAIQLLQTSLKGMSPQQQQTLKAKFDQAFGAGAADAFGKAP